MVCRLIARMLLGSVVVTGTFAATPGVLAQDWITIRAQNEEPERRGVDVDWEQASHLVNEPQNQPIVPERLAPTGPPGGYAAPLAEEGGLPPMVVPRGTTFATSWTSGDGDDLGMTDVEARQTLVFPRLPGFMVSLGTSLHFLRGPNSTDLPETLYDHSLDLRWMKKLNDCWVLDLGITPSLFTDYDNTGSDAFRMPARALALWNRSTEWQFAFGVVYLDREDIKALPAVGAIWTPNDCYKIELMFPRPRVMRLLSSDGETSRWIYLAGEFGGGSWAIDRANGTPDVFTYGALRLLVGYERKAPGGFNPRAEAGFIFNRQVEYKSGVGDYDPSNAVMLRFGGSF